MDTNTGVAPPPYRRVLHWKYFVKKATKDIFVFMLGVIIIIATVIATATLGSGGMVTGIGVMIGVIVGLVGAFRVYRRYWQWQNSPIEGDVEHGLFIVYHAESRWLFLRGSAPDQYELSETHMPTPRRTWWELWIFRNSQTLQLKSNETVLVEINDVVNVEELLAIDKYWSSLAKVELQNEKNQLEVQEQIRSELQELNAKFDRFFAYLTGADLPRETTEPGPATQELPALGDPEDPDS